ncbi:MAG: 4-alpha-glucanotransferase [Clostridiales bacterium]|nr:4-alpha-glucanotransferase [Clostridiales bacterium]
MRNAGILLPVFSLPSPYGIGTMGQAARNFIDFLSDAGQSCWQILPLGPTSYGDSPYQSFSAYGGNPYFIDLDDLAEEGLLLPSEYKNISWGRRADDIDYGLLYRRRYPVLRRACGRLLATSNDDYELFCQEQAFWLEDYALFMAIKERHGGGSWLNWPESDRLRLPKAMEAARNELAEEISFWKAVQYLFFTQWGRLKTYANQRGISIIGDLPIYVSSDSVDVWANHEQFQLDEDRRPKELSGCPPDGFSPNGQLWGNPLFDWEHMKKEGYDWWLRRIEFQFKIFDIIRIDHFRGFDSYYAIPKDETTAHRGCWKAGPSIDFFRTVNEKLENPAIIAEDLGFLTPSVRELLDYTGYPGMKVLEFAFDSRDGESDYLPHKYPKNCVVYTGTHDNDTIQGWFRSAPSADADYARRYLRLSRREGYHWGMMRAAWGSVADLAIMQMQDILGLGSKARINVPSTLGSNWRWRALPENFSPKLTKKLHGEMALYGRLPEEKDAGKEMYYET